MVTNKKLFGNINSIHVFKLLQIKNKPKICNYESAKAHEKSLFQLNHGNYYAALLLRMTDISHFAETLKVIKIISVLFFSILTFSSCTFIAQTSEQNKVAVGADILLSEKFNLIKNKRVGIITNHTALLNNGTHLVDTLFNRNDVEITALFGPEHGIRGNTADGQSIKNGIDVKTGLKVFSLYGKNKQPTKEMLRNIDIMIFDIQDIGARFYTFISTMFYAIKSAAQNEIPILILDRPNPINGIDVQGPVLSKEFKSFVGIAEIPIRHGMTVGELAKFFNRVEILETRKTAKLTVIKMKNWQRNFYYDDCKIKWIKTSPNMPTLNTAIVYPGMCLLEGTNISEGRGTKFPFLLIGSPFINSTEVIKKMHLLGLNGIELSPKIFIPKTIPHKAYKPKYENEKCNGIKLNVTNRKNFNPINFSVKLIYTFHKLYPKKFGFRNNWIDKLWGSSSLRKMIEENKTPNEIIKSWQFQLNKFKKERKQFLLY